MILVLTDNSIIERKFMDLITSLGIKDKFHITCSEEFNLATRYKEVIDMYDIAFSLHSRQIFPVEMVNKMLCINVHPGYNPINRGWFPHVFSIIDNTTAGATIHVMDSEIDHGSIIARKEVPVYLWDTSRTLYDRIIDAEIELLRDYLPGILRGDFQTYDPEDEGCMHTKKDFRDICRFDPDEPGTFLYFYNKLRALSFDDYKNAYIEDNGEKIYFKIVIQ